MNAASGKTSLWRWILILLIVGAGIGARFYFTKTSTQPTGTMEQSVRVATAERKDIPQYFSGLGVVTPQNTVLIQSRVEGQLMSLHFTEGQIVQANDLLAVIDPRPFEVQLKQAEGALARDTALLKNARLDYARYQKLMREDSVALQQVQAQEAALGQYEGVVAVDLATVANVRLQLEYCRVTAPISGRIGIKQVDVGNMIRANSAGIALITQTQPIQVVFTLVERQIPQVLAAMKLVQGQTPPARLPVEAWDQDGKNLLATGELLTLDNQIDSSTGTVKAKALFTNANDELFPNQFVNAKLRVKMMEQALTIPSAALQRNNKGVFVYIVDSAKKVTMRPVTPGYVSGEITVVEKGLELGEIVVVDGVDQLRDGTTVRF